MACIFIDRVDRLGRPRLLMIVGLAALVEDANLQAVGETDQYRSFSTPQHWQSMKLRSSLVHSTLDSARRDARPYGFSKAKNEIRARLRLLVQLAPGQ